MKKYKITVMTIILICSLFFLTGCSENKNEELKSKVISELDYVNLTIIELLNKLNNISFDNYSIISQEVELKNEQQQSKTGNQGENSSSQGGQGQQKNNGQSSGSSESQEGSDKKINVITMESNIELDKDRNYIDWSNIKKEIELLDDSWTIIILDLYSLDVENEIILDFSNKLNTSMVAIKNEDKKQSLSQLADLYSSIPRFMEAIKADKNTQKLKQTQSYVINAYILADDLGNNEINQNLTQALQVYSEIMSDIDYTKDKSQKINKVYVLLNELINSTDEDDSDIFYIKYKNLMKEIDKI